MIPIALVVVVVCVCVAISYAAGEQAGRRRVLDLAENDRDVRRQLLEHLIALEPGARLELRQ